MLVLKSLALFAFGFASVATAAPQKRSFTDLVDQFHNLGNVIRTFDSLVVAFPSTGGTVEQARAIEAYSVNYIWALINITQSATDTGKHTEQQGEIVYQILNQSYPIATGLYQHIIDKHDAISHIEGATGRIRNFLQNLQWYTRNFAQVLLSNTPAKYVELDSKIGQILDDSLSAAIDAYPY